MSEKQTGQDVKFDLVDVPVEQRSKVWMDALAEFYYAYDFRITDEFRDGRFSGACIGDLSVSSIEVDAISAFRRKSHIARDPTDSYFVLLPNGGPICLSQRGTDAVVQNEQFTLVSTNAEYSYIQNERALFNILIIPGERLRQFAPHADDLLASKIGDGTVEQMYFELENSLCLNFATLDARSREIISHSSIELLALTLDGVDYASRATPIRMAHRRRILSLIESEYRDPGFDLQRISTMLKLSKRYIQEIFSANNETASGVIRRRRITEACRLIRQYKAVHASIAEIAYSVGFSDAAHFSRVFKRETGYAPTQFPIDL